MAWWRPLLVGLALGGGAAAQPVAEPCPCDGRPALALRIVDGRPADDARERPVVVVRVPAPAAVRVGGLGVVVGRAVALHTPDSTMDRILRPAVWLGKRATVVGLVCGVAYAVGGLLVDATTTGLNGGTALAFGAVVGMPLLAGSAGFVAGAAGGAVDVGARALFGDD